MSSQETLRFIFEIQQKGNTAFIKQFLGDLQSGLSKGTASISQFNSSTSSNLSQVQSTVGKTVAIFDSFGNRVSTALKGATSSISQISGMSGSLSNIGANLQGVNRSMQDFTTFTKAAVTSSGQFDTTLRRQATSFNAARTGATAYSAIFKTIDLNQKAATASINQNTAALGANTQRMQQNDAASRSSVASQQSLTNALKQQSAAIAETTANVDKLATSQQRSQQQTMGMVRGFTTLFMGTMMVNQSMTDWRLNLESMEDLQEKIATATERHAQAVARFGEESYMAQQALGSLEKAQRAVRYEQREMANQIQNQIFLLSMIASNIVMEAIPAFQNWGETTERIRGGFERLRGGITSMMTIFPAFTSGFRDMEGGAIAVTKEMSKYEKAVFRAHNAGLAFGGGLSRIGGFLMGGGGIGLMAGLAAATIGLAMYSTNTLGARDAVNQFGVTVGGLHPVLKGLGDGLVGIAGSLGITGESAIQTRGHFSDMHEAFDDAASGWKKTVDSMIKDSNRLVSEIGKALGLLGDAAKEGSDILTGKLDPSKDETPKLDALVDVAMPWSPLLADPTQEAMNKVREQNRDPNKLVEYPYEKQLNTQTGQLEPVMMTQAEVDKRRNAIMEAMKKRDIDDTSLGSKNLAGAEEEYMDALRASSPLFTEIEGKVDTLTASYQDYAAAIKHTSVQKEIERMGAAQFLADKAEEGVALGNAVGYYEKYNEMLDTNKGKQAEVLAGRVAQIEAATKERAESFQLIGAYEELQNQISNGTALEDAYRTGLMETNIALLEREKAVMNQRGFLDALNNAIVTGQLQNVAFAEGINKQREALYGSVEAASLAAGELTELTSQLHDGTAQATAYTQAYVETQLAIQRGNVEIAAAKGEFNAWALAAKQGEIAMQSFERGVLAQNDALAKSYEALHESQGAFVQFGKQLETGIPQGIAFAQTMTDLGMAARGMEVELSKSVATLMFNQSQFKQSLTETKDAVIDLNGVMTPTIANVVKFSAATAKAFTDGRNAAYTWFNGMVEATHASAGLTLETANLANQIVGGMVPAFKQGAAATQEFIALFLKAPEAIGKVRDELKGIFDGVIDGLSDAMREGEDELDDAIDEFSDHLGIKFDNSIQEALEFHAGTDLFSDLTKEFGALFIGIGNNLDQGSFDHLKDQIGDRLENVMDKVLDDLPEGPLKDSVRSSMQGIMNLFETAELEDMKSPTAITNMLGSIGTGLMNLDGLTNNFQTTWDALMGAMLSGNLAEVNRLMGILNTDMNNLNTITFDPITSQFAMIQNSIHLTTEEVQAQIDKITELKEKYESLEFNPQNIKSASEEFDNFVAHRGEDGNMVIDAAPVQMDETPGLSLEQMRENAKKNQGTQATIDTAIASLDQLKAKTDEVMAGVQASVGTGMAGAYASFSQYVNQMTGYFGTEMGAMIQTATATFTAIGANAGAMGPPMAQVLGTVQAAFGTIMGQMINTATASFTAIGNAARVVAVNVTTHYNTAHGNAKGVLSMMESNATESFDAQGESAIAVAQGVSTHFSNAASAGKSIIGDLESAVKTSFGNMADAAGDVADAVEAIGTAAENAETKVDSLKSAVESLPDVERTITYRIRTVGSAPSGAGAGLRTGAMGIAGMVNLAEGGSVNIRDGMTRTIVTGESGDEFVRVFDKYGMMKEQIVRDIKAFSLQAGEAIQVQPLQGFYAQRFQEKYGNIINMAEGGEISSYNEHDVPIYEGEPSGEWAYNANAKVTMEDGSKERLLDWNNQDEEVRTSRMNDITALPEDYALYSNGSINRPPDWGTEPSESDDDEQNTTGGNHPPGSFGGTVTGDSNTLGTGGEGYYQTVTGYNVPDYVQSPGHGANSPTKWSSPNMDPRTWRSEQMQDDPNLWKVVDDKGINIAAKFKSKAEADEFIQEHIYHYNPTNVPPVTGGTDPNAPPPSSGGGAGGGSTSGNQQNFQYNNGDLFYEYQDGQVRTNMTEAQIRMAEQATGRTFPGRGIGGGGTGGVGGGGDIINDPYNRNLTAATWGKSYLGNGMWYDPIYLNGGGMGPIATNTGQSVYPSFPQGFPYQNQPTGPNGGPVIGGIEFPVGFPFHQNNNGLNGANGASGLSSSNVSVTGTNGTNGANGANGTNSNGQNGANGQNGTGSVINTPSQNGANGNSGQSTNFSEGLFGSNFPFNNTTNPLANTSPVSASNDAMQSQVVSQSSIIGQGNNSNIHYQSGTNSSLRIQNGVVVEATGIYSGYGNNGGTGGTGTGTGRIFTRNLGLPNTNGRADSTPESLYNNTTVKNDPTGLFPYELLPDPIFKEIATRSLLPRFAGTGGGDGGDGGSGNPNWPINIEKLLKDIFNLLKFGSNIKVNIGDEQLLNIIKGGIMDGYTNFK
jgi:hypothetical protein